MLEDIILNVAVCVVLVMVTLHHGLCDYKASALFKN